MAETLDTSTRGFTISTTLLNGTARISCIGPFDEGACDKLEDAVDLCLSATPHHLIIDLSSSRVTNACIAVVTAAAEQCATRDTTLSLRLSARQRHMLGLARVDGMVPITYGDARSNRVVPIGRATASRAPHAMR